MKSGSGGISGSINGIGGNGGGIGWRQRISGMAAGGGSVISGIISSGIGISEKMAANLATTRGAWRNGVINE
jgi:hypothetical protein